MYSQVRKALGILCCLALLPALSGCGEAAGGENEEAVLTEDCLLYTSLQDLHCIDVQVHAGIENCQNTDQCH